MTGVRLSVRSLLVLSGLLMLSACGYRLAGDGGLFPGDIRTVYVEPFISRTRQVGIEQEITSALRSEFYRRGQVRLVEQPEEADAIVSGVVRSLESQVATVNRRDEVLQYEAILVLDVTMRRRQPSEIIWRGPGTRLAQIYGGSRAAIVTSSSEFRTGTLNATDVRRLTDVQLTEIEGREVRRELMDRFARELHERLTETF